MSTSSVIPGVPSTSVPAISFTPQGPIVPSDTDVLAGVQEDINYAFGGGVNPALNTPQGQLASSTAAVISDKNSEIAMLCNQIDPQYATGRFQDAIARIYFLERKPATSTVVQCVLTGLPNTVVPAGTLAQDTSGNSYSLTASVTIGAGGTVMSQWANVTTGPVPCPAGTLTQVYQAVSGWDAISNPADGELGQDVESATEFEYRRRQSVALNGRGTVQSIRAAVLAVPNVLDCYVIDNPSSQTVLAGSTDYPLLPHSIYVAVVGGDSTAIAQAIWNKKDVGCDYNGNTSVTVTDASGYAYPQPSYAVKFEIPAALPIFFSVQLVRNAALPSNITALVQQAIVAQFNGTNGGQRATIGSLIRAAAFYGAIAGVASNVMLVDCTVGTQVNPAGTSLQVGIDQSPSITAANISVVLV